MDGLDGQSGNEIMLSIRRAAVIEIARWINIVPEETDDILSVIRPQLAELHM